MRGLVLIGGALLLSACAPSALPSDSASTPLPSQSTSSSPSESATAFCADAVATPLRETGWQVCLPAGSAVEFKKVGDNDFEARSEIGGELLLVGRYRVWKEAGGARPDSETWVLLSENAQLGKALYGRDEVEVAGDIDAAALEQLNALAIEVLLAPESYAVIGQ